MRILGRAIQEPSTDRARRCCGKARGCRANDIFGYKSPPRKGRAFKQTAADRCRHPRLCRQKLGSRIHPKKLPAAEQVRGIAADRIHISARRRHAGGTDHIDRWFYGVLGANSSKNAEREKRKRQTFYFSRQSRRACGNDNSYIRMERKWMSISYSKSRPSA